LATGLKLARPELTVIVASGDGDAFSIGGNHFLHACRRNVNLTCIVMDNEVFGMTKGQPSPTTTPEWESKLAPGGTGLNPLQPLAVALAAGAGFIARGFAGDPNDVARLLAEAILYPGFALVQILSPCVTYCPEEKLWKQQVHGMGLEPTADPVEAAGRLFAGDRLSTGIFYRAVLPSYPSAYQPVSADLSAIEAEFAL
jgi:2-oxoglutarate/2-oxoacid ferredoxin oxidoreductase subunit beta